MAWLRGAAGGAGDAGQQPAQDENYTSGAEDHLAREESALAIPFEPGAAALIRLGVELVTESYERDPQTTLARLADAATRDEPFQIPPELLVTE